MASDSPAMTLYAAIPKLLDRRRQMPILKTKAKRGASEHTAPDMLHGAAQHMEHLPNVYVKATSVLAFDAATLRGAKTARVSQSNLQQALERHMHVPTPLEILLGHHSIALRAESSESGVLLLLLLFYLKFVRTSSYNDTATTCYLLKCKRSVLWHAQFLRCSTSMPGAGGGAEEK